MRVIGRVVSRGRSIHGPLSGRECVLWSIAIDEVSTPPDFRGYALQRKSRDHRGPRWLQRFVDRDAVLFDVEDETGRAEIDVRGILTWLRRDHVRREWPPLPATALTRALERYQTPETPLRQHGGRLRAREGIVRVGEQIAVEGLARWVEADAAPDTVGYRTANRVRRLRIGPDLDAPVHATNDPTGPY